MSAVSKFAVRADLAANDRLRSVTFSENRSVPVSAPALCCDGSPAPPLNPQPHSEGEQRNPQRPDHRNPVSETDESVELNDLRPAAAVFASVDTVLEPAYLGYGRSNGGSDSYYLVLGFPF